MSAAISSTAATGPAFADRAEAGRRLGEALADRLSEADAVVYAIPRGGVPVGLEVARALDAPLQLLLVRRIGAPGAPEVALAAVIDGVEARTVINEDVARRSGADDGYIARERRAALAELSRRRALYLGARKPLDPTGRVAVIVDDGMATGATVRAAAAGLRAQGAGEIVVATPVAPRDLVEALRQDVGQVVCLVEPEPFRFVGQAYGDFHPVEDAEVMDCLRASQA